MSFHIWLATSYDKDIITHQEKKSFEKKPKKEKKLYST